MHYYTMIFDIRDTEKFSNDVAKPFVETMMSDGKLISGARLACVAKGNMNQELSEMGEYSDYLNNYISTPSSCCIQWTFHDWQNNGKPATFVEEDHTDESYS